MDLNLILLVNVGALALILLIERSKADRSWRLVNGAVFVAAVLAYLMAWEWAGFILVGIFLVTVILPAFLVWLVSRLGYANKITSSLKIARLAAFLHPSKAWRSHASLTEALAKPSLDEQCAALERLEEQWGPDWGYPARLYRLRLRAEWQDLLALPEPPTPFQHSYNGLYVLFRLQAFGSLGRIEEMVSCYFEGKNKLALVHLTDMALLWLLMFMGKYQALEDLLKTPDMVAWKALEAQDRHWMIAFSKLLAGHEAMRSVLEQLAKETKDPLRYSLRLKQLASAKSVDGLLSVDSLSRLDLEVAAVLAKPPQKPVRRFLPVTFSLIAANLIGYVYQLMTGDPSSVRALWEAGGMWPPSVLAGDWWRLLSALFLHAGWMHLALNMFALWALGTEYERKMGPWRMAAVYGLGGLFSSAMVFWLMVEGWIGKGVLVGASGSVLALFGALVALTLSDWFKTRALKSRSALRTMAGVIALQVVMDFALPGVSFTAHAAGLVAGLALGVIFYLFRR